jgi:hypothetical protein
MGIDPYWFASFGWAITGLFLGYVGAVIIAKPDGGRSRLYGGLAILIVVILGAVLNYANSVALQRQATKLRDSIACQARFNTQYRSALDAHLRASSMDSRALLEFLEQFRRIDIPESQSREQPFVVIENHMAEAEKLRADHPIPVDNPCL